MKRKIILISIPLLIILILILIIRPYYTFATKTLGVSPLKILFTFDNLKKTNNYVNILLLGKAGGTHDGPNLTDSINIASINLETHTISLFSLPRDIWSEPLQEKINAAYAVGEIKEPGKGGLILAKAEMGAVIGQPIHYAAVIDFEKFKELIDYLGGIDITVDTTFTDPQYPITGKEDDLCGGDPDYKCRYETLTFHKGTTHLNGETALKFVRSRHGDNGEGSDFARGKRQQKVIDEVVNKTLEVVKTKNLSKIEKLYEFYNQIIERDISNENVAYIMKHFISTKKPIINKISIDTDFFEVPDLSVYGAYVLIPKDKNFQTIHEYVDCYLQSKGNCENIKNRAKNE